MAAESECWFGRLIEIRYTYTQSRAEDSLVIGRNGDDEEEDEKEKRDERQTRRKPSEWRVGWLADTGSITGFMC